MTAKLSNLAAGRALVALDVLNSDNAVRPAAANTQSHVARREELADQARLSYVDRVRLHRNATPIEFAQLGGNHRSARRIAEANLQAIASEQGLSPHELVSAVRDHVRVMADLKPITVPVAQNLSMRDPVQYKGPLRFDSTGVKALRDVNEMVGSWKFKMGIAQLVELSQFRAMSGKPTRGDNSAHILLVGPSGCGKSTVLEKILAPLCFNMRLIATNRAVVIPASDLIGVNRGKTREAVADAWQRAENALLATDEITGIASASDKNEVMGTLHAAMAYKMQQDEFRSSLHCGAGYPGDVATYLEQNSGYPSRYGTILELSALTATELTHVFLLQAAKEDYQVDEAVFEAVHSYFSRMAISPSTGGARFAQSALSQWSTHMGGRTLADLTAEAISPAQARVFHPVDIRPVKGAYVTLAAFPESVTQDDVVRHLEKDVLGQRHILESVAEALVKRRRMKTLTDETRKPIGRFIFAGPSAAGKSLLTKSIARTFMTEEDIEEGREPPIFKVDMQTIKSLQAWLGGAQAGYIGYDDVPALLKWMKENPGGVLEFAETDKGPEDTMNVLMEIFDTGFFRSQKGQEYTFTNYVMIGTGNYGNEAGVHRRKKIENKLAEKGFTTVGQVFALGAMVTDKGVPVGGSMMTITADFADNGSGKVEVIGNSKNVMNESSAIALRHVRKHGLQYGIDQAVLDALPKRDLTVYYEPAGVEKDGPSAGITMATAIVSQLRNEAVPSNMAMTGEITFTGAVRPVGGIREKLFAAVQNGCDTFVLPAENRKDTEDLPEAMRDKIRLIFVDTFDQVVEAVFDAKNAEPVTNHPIGDDVERQIIEARTQEYMRRKMPPEHLGRLSEGKALVFQQHTEETMRQIVTDLLRRESGKQLQSTQLTLEMAPSALDQMMTLWNPDTGPRPIVDAMMGKIVSPLIHEQLVKPDLYPKQARVTVHYEDKRFEFTVAPSNEDPDRVSEWGAASAAFPAFPAFAPSTPTKAPFVPLFAKGGALDLRKLRSAR